MDVVFSSSMRVELIKSLACDADVVMAARVSTLGEKAGLGEGSSKKDAGLIRYLMSNRHGTPFEHNSFTYRVGAPIFVFREFIRHRIASYNEESGRYRRLDPKFYIPDSDRLLVQVGRPGAYEFVAGSASQYELLVERLKEQSLSAYAAYLELLEAGVAREVARCLLPLNLYSTMYVTLNARSLMNFISLRVKEPYSRYPTYPQWEIELCARQMEALWQGLMPVTHRVFCELGRVAP